MPPGRVTARVSPLSPPLSGPHCAGHPGTTPVWEGRPTSGDSPVPPAPVLGWQVPGKAGTGLEEESMLWVQTPAFYRLAV